jgi:hypothetical protein
MDNQYAFATKDDIWRFQGDLKSIYAVQNEHADRLLRLERRFEDDGRAKSVWGTTSFHSVRGGTPHQGEQLRCLVRYLLTTYRPTIQSRRGSIQEL